MSMELIETEAVEKPADYDEHRTHIVTPPKNLHIFEPWMEGTDVVAKARAEGIEIEALCGYRFIPKRNPEHYAACDNCMRIAGEIMNRLGE